MNEPLRSASPPAPASLPLAAGLHPPGAGGGLRGLRGRRCVGWLAMAPVLLALACTRGSGTPGTLTRDLDEFDRLDVGGPFSVRVTLGAPAHLEITGDDNVIPEVTSERRGSTLHLGLPGRVSLELPLEVTLTTPRLEELDASGASTVRVEGLSGREFELDVSGASTVVLAGEVQALDIEASGASKVRAEGLRAAAAEAEASGASTIEVRASEELDAKTSGAAQLRYYGAPARISRDSSGSSSIKAVD